MRSLLAPGIAGRRLRNALGWAAILLAALLAFWPMPGGAAPFAIDVTGQESGQPVGHWFEQVLDPGGRADLAQIRALKSGWKPAAHDTLAFGISGGTWWVRARLVNVGDRPVEEVLDLGSAVQDYAHFTLLRPDGTVLADSLRGDRLPFPTQGLLSRTSALPFTLQPHEAADLFIRFNTYDGFFETMPVSLSERQAFLQRENRTQLLLSLYHGGLLGLVLFNVFMFASTGEASFGFYILYLSAFLVNSFCFRGFDLEYLWPHWPGLHNRLVVSTAGLSFAAGGIFVISYGRLREHGPNWLRRLIVALILLDLIGAALGAADYYLFAAVFQGLVGLFQVIPLTGCTIWLSLRRVRQAYFLTVAFVVIDMAASAYYLEVAGIVETGGWSMVGLLAGSAFEMLVLACGLADTLNLLKSQKLAAERSALQAQQALTTALEAQVAERTSALAAVNSQLRRLALTDELTGAFNRRHFNNMLAELVGPDRPKSGPLGLCMFDVDHFKRFNDTYGHPAGDAALRAVTGAVQDALRDPGDCLFRIGGEEFAVIMRTSSADATQDCAERLRLAVQGLAIPHALNAPPVVTASFGSAWWSGERSGQETAERLVATADRMLYLAKENGRNRIVNAMPDA